MAVALSLEFRFQWTPGAGIQLRHRTDADATAGDHDGTTTVDHLNAIRNSLAESARHPVIIPTQFKAATSLGLTLRECFKDAASHMEDVANGLIETGPDSAPPKGYSTWSRHILANQLCDVAARLIVEEMLWWLSNPAVLAAVCDETNPPETHLDSVRFPRRAKALARVVPRLNARMREFGISRMSSVVEAETWRLLVVRIREMSGSPAESLIPSVDVMMDAVDGVDYGRDEKYAASPGDADIRRRVHFARVPPTLRVRLVKSILVTANAGGRAQERPNARDATVTRRDFIIRMGATSVTSTTSALAMAYDMRLPDYVDGINGATHIAQTISDALFSVLDAPTAPGL
jgi:hypothetical protein